MKSSSCALLALWFALVLGTGEAALTCMDASGKPVDWFIVYKLPEDRSSQFPQVQEGYGQMYMDVNNPTLKLSDVWINDTKHAIAYTLQQIYENSGSTDVAYMMYNDEFPDGGRTTEYHGHTKGDLAFDNTSGFWLVHSTPKFPSNSSMSYNWPHNGRLYGQSFLCVTYKYDQFENIGKQLLYNDPYIYDTNLPPNLVQNTPSLKAVAEHKRVTSPPWNRTASLTSAAGQSFISFAKAKEYNQDLYAAFVAPFLDTPLYANTWLNGHGDLNSSCVKGHLVNDVKYLDLTGGEAFKNSKDHCKWAVSSKAGTSWTCIGDINRMCHQLVRGGGTVCFQNADVHKNFFSAVKEFQKCPQTTHCPSHHNSVAFLEGIGLE